MYCASYSYSDSYKGSLVQPCAFIASIRGLYLVYLVCMACSINLSCVKVNSMICIFRSGVGIKGLFCLYVAPCMHTMLGCNFVRHSHRVLLHMHLSIHGGMVLSC